MSDNGTFTRRIEGGGELDWYWKRRFSSAPDLKKLM